MTEEDLNVCPRSQAKFISIPVLTYSQAHLRANVSALDINSHSYAKSTFQRSVVILKGKFVENFSHSHPSWYLNMHFPGQKPAFLCGWHKSPSFPPQSSLEITFPTEKYSKLAYSVLPHECSMFSDKKYSQIALLYSLVAMCN